jgi:hypothetical protein
MSHLNATMTTTTTTTMTPGSLLGVGASGTV